MERVDKLISTFMKRQFGVSLGQISSKLRSDLLQRVEHVPCNLCESDASVEIARRDKFELPVTSVLCRNCGLIYLNPRPTAQSYDRFYAEGGDREGVYHVSVGFAHLEGLLQRYYGPQFSMSDTDHAELKRFVREKFAEHCGASADGLTDDEVPRALEAKAKEFEAREYDAYADDIYSYFREFVPRNGNVFEVGAGWGKLLVPWRDRHGCEVTGLEPRIRTVQAAKERVGIELFTGFPATAVIPEDTYDAVQNLRTINHMIDPLGDLRHVWRWLKPGGVLLVDIADAVREARYEGFENNVVEIDHPYAFSGNTLAAMVQKAGFEIVKCDIVDIKHVLKKDQHDPEYKQIRIVARKSLQPVQVTWPDPMQELAALVRAQLDRESNLLSGKSKPKATPSEAKPSKVKPGKVKPEQKTATEPNAAKSKLPAAANFWSRLKGSRKRASG